MKRFLYVLVALALLVPTVVSAADGPYFQAHIGGPAPTGTNHPEFWEAKFAAEGAVCKKVNFSIDDGGKTLTEDHDLLVIKADADEFANAYWFDVKAGEFYTHPTKGSISHIIVCDFEDDPPQWESLWSGSNTDCYGMTISWGFTPAGIEPYLDVYINGSLVADNSTGTFMGKTGSFEIAFYFMGKYIATHGPYIWIEPEYCYEPGDPDLVVLNDCEGYEVIYIPDSNFPDRGTSLFSGQWTGPKDVLEKVDFPGDEELKIEGFTIYEPRECYECIPETVFYWSDGLCELRQRGGPIGGQTRPFHFDQNTYCGCGYAHDDGWVGLFANSCSDPDEYKYWNELPQFCGAQSCE